MVLIALLRVQQNWQTVSTQNAAGDTKNTQTYKATDQNAQNGVNYYRLKMIDRDSTFEYSPMRSIAVEKAKEFVLYPNPVKGMLRIAKSVNVETITIYNLMGSKVFQKIINGADQVAIGALRAGNYVVEAQLANGEKLVQQLLVEELIKE